MSTEVNWELQISWNDRRLARDKRSSDKNRNNWSGIEKVLGIITTFSLMIDKAPKQLNNDDIKI